MPRLPLTARPSLRAPSCGALTAQLALPVLLATLALGLPHALHAAAPVREIAPGPFKADWNSLDRYECPEWFRDAKLGFWARWDVQSVPEQGDDYARNIYVPTDPRFPRPNAQYVWHIDHYGHPSRTGFKDLIPRWTASQWAPEIILDLYQRAGARYFIALANDHANFDCFDSKYQPWNSVAFGPKKDLVGIWAAAARAAGLRFGVSVAAADAWTWFEPAQRSDTSGPFFGAGYDGRLTPSDGRGQWWNGLDPQDLYAQGHLPGAKPDAAYVTKFFLRTRDLLDRYHPDLLCFDDDSLPLGEAGLNLAAHLYNSSLAAHGGKMDAVLSTQKVPPLHTAALVEGYERATSARLVPAPWQATTSLGATWQYRAGQKYRPVGELVRQLVDVVSKNGNLLINVPLRASGIPDTEEVLLLDQLTAWIAVHGEAIYGTRPWKVFGEGPSLSLPAPEGVLAETRLAFTPQDFRFTQAKDGRTLYVFLLGWPKDGQLTVKSLAKTGAKTDLLEKRPASVTLLGSLEKITWTQDATGLHVTLPAPAPSDSACALKFVLE